MATIRLFLICFLASLPFVSSGQDIRIDMAKKYSFMIGTRLHMFPDPKREKKAYIETVYVMDSLEMLPVKKHKHLPPNAKFLSLTINVDAKLYFVTFEDFERIRVEKNLSEGKFLSQLYGDNFMFTYDEKRDTIVIVPID